MVTTVSYGDNKQTDLWLRNTHKRCQAAAVVQLRVWLSWEDARPRFDLGLLDP